MSALTKLFHGKTKAEVKEASDVICKAIKAKKITRENVSFRDIGEAVLGYEAMATIRDSQPDVVGEATKENVDPVSLSLFTNITGLLVLQDVVQEYQSPDFIGDLLVRNETSKEDNTRQPGLANIDDDAIEVKEGEEYPDTKFGEDYIDIPKSIKVGLKIGLTREALFFDRTGDLVRKAQQVGNRIATNREKRILRVVLGITNPFTRKGVARNTYVASGGTEPRPNKLASTKFTDWNSLETAYNLFIAMNDDRTVGEPIQVRPNTILASPGKEWNINRILNSSEVRTTSQSAVVTTIGASPIAGKGLKVITSPWVDNLLVANGATISQAREYWEIGDFKKAFVYRTVFPLQVIQAAPNDYMNFERDVVAQWRGSERGVCYVEAPWNVAQFYDT